MKERYNTEKRFYIEAINEIKMRISELDDDKTRTTGIEIAVENCKISKTAERAKILNNLLKDRGASMKLLLAKKKELDNLYNLNHAYSDDHLIFDFKEQPSPKSNTNSMVFDKFIKQKQVKASSELEKMQNEIKTLNTVKTLLAMREY